MLKIITAICILMSLCTTAYAAPKVTENWRYYKVNGKNPAAIKAYMNANGPSGYWAYSHWYVSWSSTCKVTVRLEYTFPKLRNRAKLSAAVLKKWDTMLAHLKAHEKQHGQHGINAGNAIAKDKCRNGDVIIRKWTNQDKVFDRKTGHGKKTGVVFK